MIGHTPLRAALLVLLVLMGAPALVGAQPDADAPSPASDWTWDDEEPLEPIDDEFAWDPWEPMNRKTFAFNLWLDDHAIRPIAGVYARALPMGARQSVDHFFYNARVPRRFANNLLQGKPLQALHSLLEFAVNTVFGLGGFFDVAKPLYGLDADDEDFGQTLGVYRIPHGPYLVLPFLGPSTVRDTVGQAGDILMNPLTWILSGPAFFGVFAGAEFTWRVNYRSMHLDMFEDVDRFALDPYISVQDFYLQNRDRGTRE